VGERETEQKKASENNAESGIWKSRGWTNVNSNTSNTE